MHFTNDPGFGTPLDRLRLERDVKHLVDLGPRATMEFLTELDARTGVGPAILSLLGEYRCLTLKMLKVAGADKFARRPLHAVPPS